MLLSYLLAIKQQKNSLGKLFTVKVFRVSLKNVRGGNEDRAFA